MVDALHKTHALLKPSGILIDIHPTEDITVEVRSCDDVTPVGWMNDEDDKLDIQYADRALAEVVEQGLFRAEQSDSFVFHGYADTAEEHRAQHPTWTSKPPGSQALEAAEQMLSDDIPDQTIVIVELTTILRLRKADRL